MAGGPQAKVRNVCANVWAGHSLSLFLSLSMPAVFTYVPAAAAQIEHAASAGAVLPAVRVRRGVDRGAAVRVRMPSGGT